MAISAQAYYTNDSLWGSGQYIMLPELIDNFILTRTGPDKEVSSVKRHEVIFHAKGAIKEFGFDGSKEIKIIEININPLLSVIMPPDYIDWVRISVNDNGVLTTLRQNQKTSTAVKYIQDNAGDVLFDVNGDVQTGVSALDLARISGSTYSGPGIYNGCFGYCYNECWYFRYTINPYDSNNTISTFDIDRLKGVINFSSDLNGRTIVLEYITDGNIDGDNENIGINKLAEEYVYAYVKWALLNEKQGVAEYVKNRAKNQKKAMWSNAKIRISNAKAGRMIDIIRSRF